jgi:4-hydroxy-tetrahydrodipicolinate reductase
LIRIVVCGAGGRMGGAVIDAACQQDDIQVVAGVEAPDHPLIGHTTAGYEIPVVRDLLEVIEACDVVVDFTKPDASLDHLEQAVSEKTPMVIGTTGFNPDQMKRLHKLASNVPCLLSPNMSIGMNLVMQVAAELAKRLGPRYDVEIVEAHHRAKVDAPSGTALRLAGLIGAALERSPGTIPLHSLRGGDVPGEHTVVFMGPGETVELTHRVLSRNTFAQGTLIAVRFIAQARPGLYSMQDAI